MTMANTSSPPASHGRGTVPARATFARLRRPLVGFILFSLAALVLVPALLGRRTDALRQQRNETVVPAQDALQETRSLLTEQLAAVRGHLVSGETTYLARLSDAIAADAPALDRLTTLAERIGPEASAAARVFAVRAAEWQEAPRGLLDGSLTRDQLAESLEVGQRRFEAALEAADGVGDALNRAALRLDERIRAAEATERLTTIILALAALAAAVIVVWLTRRLQHITRQLQERAERLRASEERFRLIAENLREMIWISDPGYTVQYYLSPAYERIWGRSIAEARRNPRSFLEAVVPEDRERVEAALEGYARGEYAAEYRIVRPDGEVRWISGRGYPVRDDDGAIFRIAGIAEDITEQKQAEQQLGSLLEQERLAREESEAALRLRDQVVRIVSHDLKNPLHTIGMAAELLEMPLPEEQRSRQLGIIRRTVARANRMVNDLLDAARLQSGRTIAVVPEPLDVRPLLEEAGEAFAHQAEARNQQLTVSIDGAVPAVLGDRDRLLQALTNLIGNSVKFTPEGGRVHVAAAVDAMGCVQFSVIDTGPGIAAEMLPRLFEPFSQARDTASLGTGLGLAITRGIVEAHGGRIAVQSEPGAGTTFTMTVPAAPGADLERSPEERRTMTDRRTQTDGLHRHASDRVDDAGGRLHPRPVPYEQGTYADPVDDALDDSFPASDPPQWWGGDDQR